jgi:hypothetical protein
MKFYWYDGHLFIVRAGGFGWWKSRRLIFMYQIKSVKIKSAQAGIGALVGFANLAINNTVVITGPMRLMTNMT